MCLPFFKYKLGIEAEEKCRLISPLHVDRVVKGDVFIRRRMLLKDMGYNDCKYW
jgi:hypothetical protein